MASIVWTASEKRYVKAIIAWQNRTEQSETSLHTREPAPDPEDDLRVLLIGAQGVGKTSLLRRLCCDEFNEITAHDRRFARGGRRAVVIASGAHTLDVLEMPSAYVFPLCTELPDDIFDGYDDYEGIDGTDNAAILSTTLTRSTPASMVLTQAVALTQAAVIVYDVTDADSFTQAMLLYRRVLHESRRGVDPEYVWAKTTPTDGRNASSRPAEPSTKNAYVRRLPLLQRFKKKGNKGKEGKEGKDKKKKNAAVEASTTETATPANPNSPPPPCYSIVLVGNKCDVDDADRRVDRDDARRAAHAVATAAEESVAATLAAAAAAHNPSSAAAAYQKPPPYSFPSAGFLETSAKTGEGVVALFQHAARAILRQQRDVPAGDEEPEPAVDPEREDLFSEDKKEEPATAAAAAADPPFPVSAVSTASSDTARKSLDLRTQPRHLASVGSPADKTAATAAAAAPAVKRVLGLSFRHRSTADSAA